MLTEKISFPKSAATGFPLGSLLDSYLRNLLPVSPLHSELARLVFRRIGLEPSRELLCRFAVDRFPVRVLEKLEEAEDVDDLIRVMGGIAGKTSTLDHETALRRYLRTSIRSNHASQEVRPPKYMGKLIQLGKELGLRFPETGYALDSTHP
jgi:hypothetical protein